MSPSGFDFERGHMKETLEYIDKISLSYQLRFLAEMQYYLTYIDNKITNRVQ